MRPSRTTVDYFPHMTTSGRTIFILEKLYGNDGYAAWFKILEVLGSTTGHAYDYNSPANFQYLLAKIGVNEERMLEILNTLAELEAIDQELFKGKIIWSDNFLEKITPVYSKRSTEIPTKPEFSGRKLSKGRVSGEKTPQSKAKESKAKESILGHDCPPPSEQIPYAEIVGALNESTGSKFKPDSDATKRHIKARFKDGYSKEDFLAVISSKAGEWGKDSKMQEYLRPATLFGPKFESYLEAARKTGRVTASSSDRCKGSCDYGVRGHCNDRPDDTCLSCTSFRVATI